MSDKFLNTGGGGSNISNGTANVYAAVLGAVNLNASMPIKTNSTKQLVSEKLDISDVQSLSSELSLKPELTFTEGDTHSTPANGQVKIYAKLDGNMYKKNDQGVESGIGGGGGSGDVVGPISSVDNAIAFFDGTTGKIIKENTDFKFITGATYGDQLKVPDIETDDHFSVNEELQKITNFTTATEGATPITTITGELDVKKIKSYEHNAEIEFDNNNLAMNADGDIQLNSDRITLTGNTIITGDLEVGGEDDFLVACGTGNSTIAYSSDSGNTWTGVLPKTVLTTSAQDATFGNNTWVAVGSGGGNTIVQSSDGVNWTGVANPFTAAYGVGFGNNLFVALGNTSFGNSIATSPDGITWTGRGNSIFTNYGTVAKYANGIWVAGGSGSNCLAHSFDGINWVGIGTVLIMANCFDVIWDGARWVAVGTGGQNTILTSPDGITWTGLGVLNFSSSSIAYDGSTYVIATNVGLEYSTDLLNWTTSTTTVGVGKSVIWTGDKFVATGTSGDVQTSTDGITWSTVSTGLFSTGLGLGIKTSAPPTLEITGGKVLGLPFDLIFAATDEVSTITTTGQKIQLRVPQDFITSKIKISVNTVGGAGFNVGIAKNGGGVAIINQDNLLVSNTESVENYVEDDIVSLEVGGVGLGTATGLKCYLIGKTT